VLFTLAEDLTKMELDVDEADVGQMRPGQEATFTSTAGKAPCTWRKRPLKSKHRRNRPISSSPANDVSPDAS
jgi:hypothetical protein